MRSERKNNYISSLDKILHDIGYTTLKKKKNKSKIEVEHVFYTKYMYQNCLDVKMRTHSTEKRTKLSLMPLIAMVENYR